MTRWAAGDNPPPPPYASAMTVVLAIDTAAPRLQLALRLPDGRTDVLVEDMAQGQAERIFPAIGELLARNGIAYRDLGRVAVTTGPGSFTGLRIGLSAARGLGLALGITVIGVPSLLAIALAADSAAPVVVLLDARRGEAYVEVFAAGGGSATGPRLLPVAEARALVPPGAAVIESPFPDVARLAQFALTADPAAFPPEPAYIRDADAKPQQKFRIARK